MFVAMRRKKKTLTYSYRALGQVPDKTIVNTRKLFPQITDKGMIVDETIVRKKMAEKDKKESEGAKVARDFIARSVEMEVPSSLEFLPWSLCFSCIITEEAQS